jgi:hypothetical protein
MGLRTAASLTPATTIQIDCLSGFLRCFEVTVRPYPATHHDSHDEADTNNNTERNWFQDDSAGICAAKQK